MEKQKYPCPCCEYKTLDDPDGHYDICSVCFWEDDPIQFDDPDYEGGANIVSLNRAKSNYKEFGACEKDALRYVRGSLKEEKL